jgi:hypothetical protein
MNAAAPVSAAGGGLFEIKKGAASAAPFRLYSDP